MQTKLKLAGYLLIITFTCSAQNENLTTPQPVQHQFYRDLNSDSYVSTDSIVQDVMHKIDSIGNTQGIASPFCKAYSRSMQNVATQMRGMDSAAQFFIKKFEIRFAAYFLEALAEYENGFIPSSPVWHCYFSQREAQPWQLVLLGVNAHVNGDMWQSLVNEFSHDEIRLHQKHFISFQRSIAKNYDVFFDELMSQNGYVRFINSFTKGLAKFIGERIIRKWRRRQVRLAILFYTGDKTFNKQQEVVNRKKQKIDQIILRKTKTSVLTTPGL